MREFTCDYFRCVFYFQHLIQLLISWLQMEKHLQNKQITSRFSKCDHFKTILSCRFGRSYLHHVKLHHRIKRLFYPFHWPLTSYHVSTRYSSWVYTSWDGKAPSSNQVAVVSDALGWDPLFASEFGASSWERFAPQFFTSHGFHTKRNDTNI